MPLPKLYNDDGDGFIVIAHRGASADFPENTMPAFEAAVERGAEMIELDVLMSRDGVPVVFHDARLNRHTDGAGPLADHSLEQLRELDAGSWFGERFAGTKIPTLEEVVRWARGKIALNLEIKTGAVGEKPRGGVEEKAAELVREYGMEEHVIFSSFDYRAVRRFKRISPDLSVALLYNRGLSGDKSPSHLVSEYGVDAFNCSYTQLSDKRLKNLKEYGIPFLVYTVDSPRRMRRLIRRGAAGIFSNKPGLLREVAEEVR
ncbi:MAG: glycerophosphodiester phosphodiesterase family protein [Balneolaceae bacterium]|nr:glycerophosphodiester phosphodiesterase family protein [Balneolaceae bacterium]